MSDTQAPQTQTQPVTQPAAPAADAPAQEPKKYNRVYVSNLSWSTTLDALLAHFRALLDAPSAPSSSVLSGEIFADRMRRSAGCGLVELDSPESVARAIAEANEKELDGRKVYVREDREPAKPLSGRGFGRGGVAAGQRTKPRRKDAAQHMDGENAAAPAGGNGEENGEKQREQAATGGNGGENNEQPAKGRKLVVFNLPYRYRWYDLKDLFREHGEVLRADIVTEGGPHGRSRGWGTVLFATEEEAEKALNEMNGSEVDGRTINVKYDKYA